MGGWKYFSRTIQKSRKSFELVWGGWVFLSPLQKNFQLISFIKKYNNQSHRGNFFFEGFKVFVHRVDSLPN